MPYAVGGGHFGGFLFLFLFCFSGGLGSADFLRIVHCQQDSRRSIPTIAAKRALAIWKITIADGTFPFHSCGQTVVHPRFLVEPEDEELHLVTGHVAYGQTISGIGTGPSAHNFVPEPACDRGFGDVEMMDSAMYGVRRTKTGGDQEHFQGSISLLRACRSVVLSGKMTGECCNQHQDDQSDARF